MWCGWINARVRVFVFFFSFLFFFFSLYYIILYLYIIYSCFVFFFFFFFFLLCWCNYSQEISSLHFPAIFGLLLNTSQSHLLGAYTSQHWFAIRDINNVFYNLNSFLNEPYKFKSFDEVCLFVVCICICL